MGTPVWGRAALLAGTLVSGTVTARLTQPSRRRYGCLERILPAAQGFQEAVDAFQEWLGATERQLAQLWRADGCVGRVQDAHQQTQVGTGWTQGGHRVDTGTCVITGRCYRPSVRRSVGAWESWMAPWRAGSGSWRW